MAESQNQVEHMGVTVWVEKSLKKKRYEIASIAKSGNTTRAGLDIFPGFCGSSKGCPGKLFLCWEFAPEWPDEQGSLLAEISVSPAVDAKDDRIVERKIYVLVKGVSMGQQYTSAQNSPFLSKGIPLYVYRVNDNELIVSAKLNIHRLRPAIDQKMAEALLMEANERCYSIPAAVLADLLETDQPLMTFEFDFHRRKKAHVTSPRMTPSAGAPSMKRKRPAKSSAQDSDSDPQYQPRRGRRRPREGSIIDLRSPDSKPVLADDEEEPEDQLAILEELERQEIELEQEAARKIQEKRDRIKKLKRALAK